ncbi:MAG TPA: hypothetical protein VLA79_18795, partial [Polyangia bacterium]|nr:hypothetical protein [Polyangia bacterium]
RKTKVNGEFAGEARRLAEIVVDAESVDATLAGRPILLEGTVLGEGTPGEAAEGGAEEEPEVIYVDDDRHRGRDRGRDRGHDRGQDRGPDRGRGPSNAPRPPLAPSVASASPPMNLAALASAARALLSPELRPAFLGGGAFGGPWSRAE